MQIKKSLGQWCSEYLWGKNSTFSSNLTQLTEEVTCQILSVAEFTGWLALLPKFGNRCNFPILIDFFFSKIKISQAMVTTSVTATTTFVTNI